MHAATPNDISNVLSCQFFAGRNDFYSLSLVGFCCNSFEPTLHRKKPFYCQCHRFFFFKSSISYRMAWNCQYWRWCIHCMHPIRQLLHSVQIDHFYGGIVTFHLLSQRSQFRGIILWAQYSIFCSILKIGWKRTMSKCHWVDGSSFQCVD